jgi:hypothetical protein
MCWRAQHGVAWLHSLRIAKRHLLRRPDGERILRARYSHVHGAELDIDHPTTFTEKLYKRLIEQHYRPNPAFTRLADKYQARQHVDNVVGSKYLIPMIWDGTDPTKIPFDQLPQKSIAMTNHGCGRNIVLEQPINRAAVITQLQDWLSQNYYWAMREAWYYSIKPRIMIEEFIGEDWPLDYRFWCFHGKVEAIQMDDHAHRLNAFYDASWRNMQLAYRQVGEQRNVERPENLVEMIRVATRLSAAFDFVRIDLYSVNRKTYFGEFHLPPLAVQTNSIRHIGIRILESCGTTQLGADSKRRARPSRSGVGRHNFSEANILAWRVEHRLGQQLLQLALSRPPTPSCCINFIRRGTKGSSSLLMSNKFVERPTLLAG